MAKKDVVRLLVRLFGDPKLNDSYRANPAKVLKSAKLTAKERELLSSGDEKAIRAYLGAASAKANVIQSGLANVIQEAVSKVRVGVANVIQTAVPKSSKKPPKSS